MTKVGKSSVMILKDSLQRNFSKFSISSQTSISYRFSVIVIVVTAQLPFSLTVSDNNCFVAYYFMDHWNMCISTTFVKEFDYKTRQPTFIDKFQIFSKMKEIGKIELVEVVWVLYCNQILASKRLIGD